MTTKEETAVAKSEPTYSERFTNMVTKEFGATIGQVNLSPYQKQLAQHLFIGIDTQLKALEAKRNTSKNKVPIAWANVNMQKLAIDAVHRIELGLDALIPNHIHPVPYLNGATKKYDLDLRVGYVGKDCYRRKMAPEEPVDVRYELVHENDEFEPLMKSQDNDVESYRFRVTKPFDRGQVIGGFGYIIYQDPAKNKLVMLSRADFDKSKKAAMSDKFWGAHEREMQYKTLVHRTTEKIPIDPMKVNASFAVVEAQEHQGPAFLDEGQADIDTRGNADIIDVDPEPTPEEEPPDEAAQTQEAQPENEEDDDLEAIIEGKGEQQSFTGTDGPDF